MNITQAPSVTGELLDPMDTEAEAGTEAETEPGGGTS
jgi:hypothetical protein